MSKNARIFNVDFYRDTPPGINLRADFAEDVEFHNVDSATYFNKTMDIDITFHPSSKNTVRSSKGCWISSKDPRISRIKKVIVNGPATIIIDHEGNKTVVKYRDISYGYDPIFGFYVCLLRYILDNEKYHDVMIAIFENKGDCVDRKEFLKTVLYSHLSHKEMEKITEKFVMDNFLYSPSKRFTMFGNLMTKQAVKEFKKTVKDMKQIFKSQE